MNRLKQRYTDKIAKEMLKEFKYENVMQVPAIKKIVINAGIGPFRESREAVDSFVADFANLSGQKPSPRPARLSVASFKVRQNDVVGYTVTLRGERMWAFLDKLINIALPRVRDFRGLSRTAFDERGNYSIGIKEHVIFPEVNPNATKGTRSLQMTIVIVGGNKTENTYLLKELGVPFKE